MMPEMTKLWSVLCLLLFNRTDDSETSLIEPPMNGDQLGNGSGAELATSFRADVEGRGQRIVESRLIELIQSVAQKLTFAIRKTRMVTMSTLCELQSWLIYHWIPKDNIHFMSENFKSRDVGLRAQKKILSRMANKNVAKMFIDDTTASLLDNLYKLAKTYTDNKKESEKLIKNIIKIVIKIGVLYRNGQFTQDELRFADKFKNKFHAAAMAVMSFNEVDFSYDRHYLKTALQESHQAIRQLVEKHLTEKSLVRIDSVFNFFSDPDFLDAVFKPNSEYKDILDRLVSDMNKAMDEGEM